MKEKEIYLSDLRSLKQNISNKIMEAIQDLEAKNLKKIEKKIEKASQKIALGLMKASLKNAEQLTRRITQVVSPVSASKPSSRVKKSNLHPVRHSVRNSASDAANVSKPKRGRPSASVSEKEPISNKELTNKALTGKTIGSAIPTLTVKANKPTRIGKKTTIRKPGPSATISFSDSTLESPKRRGRPARKGGDQAPNVALTTGQAVTESVRRGRPAAGSAKNSRSKRVDSGFTTPTSSPGMSGIAPIKKRGRPFAVKPGNIFFDADSLATRKTPGRARTSSPKSLFNPSEVVKAKRGRPAASKISLGEPAASSSSDLSLGTKKGRPRKSLKMPGSVSGPVSASALFGETPMSSSTVNPATTAKTARTIKNAKTAKTAILSNPERTTKITRGTRQKAISNNLSKSSLKSSSKSSSASSSTDSPSASSLSIGMDLLKAKRGRPFAKKDELDVLPKAKSSDAKPRGRPKQNKVTESGSSSGSLSGSLSGSSSNVSTEPANKPDASGQDSIPTGFEKQQESGDPSTDQS